MTQLALRLALCLSAGWFAYSKVGPVGIAVVGGLGALVLAGPLMHLGAALYRTTRALALRDVEGRYYVYRGTPVTVHEDEDHVRWVRAADVRAILGPGAADATLARTYGDGWRVIRGAGHFSAETLLLHLGRDSRPEALKLRHWVERDIAFPARRVRTRHGDSEPAAPAADLPPGPGSGADPGTRQAGELEGAERDQQHRGQAPNRGQQR